MRKVNVASFHQVSSPGKWDLLRFKLPSCLQAALGFLGNPALISQPRLVERIWDENVRIFAKRSTYIHLAAKEVNATRTKGLRDFERSAHVA